jgi:hypothetical protein
MIGTSELVVWIPLAIGALVAHWVGLEFGIIVGVSLGFALLLLWFYVVAHVEKSSALCECSNCLKVLRYDQCTPKRGGSTT